jgi:hypothetical protein
MASPPETVFLNVCGAQESILRNEFRQPMYSQNLYLKKKLWSPGIDSKE